ncbi:AGE family epimerase/isomerase [Saccharicrinis aurantiacus]|uniref:AGE family epimerase/isomerase n=1 Tax=Saccharicrinis aurantiacus TaxID=1849719 RepID=UPI00094F7A09|nr:AGE family epimerase/isomerase [Saccharicrinis aurantiacus]
MINNLQKLKTELENELTRLLDYWSHEAIDFKNGGFIGRIKNGGVKDWDSEKGMVLNARILWTFSSAYRVTQLTKYKEIAKKAYEYLMKYFWDTEYGGFIWSVTNSGLPLNERKQTYAQGFGVYALSEYYRATGDEESLSYACKTFVLIEERCRDEKFGGYIEAFDKSWSVLEDMRLSVKDDNTPKSMNTHLHILEPYTNLYRIWPNKKLKERIVNLLGLFENNIVDPESGHFNLFFSMDWSVQSTAVSYGHDIEGAWLLHEAAQEIKDENLINDIQKTALRLVDITIKEGTDSDGSVFYEKDNGDLDTEKHWWPQAEAMVGLYDAWEIEPKQIYQDHIFKVWEFIKTNLMDLEYGEWYWSVDEKGLPNENEDKVGFWKCPYHNTRALIELFERINKQGSDL